MPLYSHACTVLVASTCQLVTWAVTSNSLVPSARTFGASGWPPSPAVFTGYDFICAVIALSI